MRIINTNTINKTNIRLMSENKTKVQLSAIDPVVVSNLVLPVESRKRGSDWIS